ncbi:MAG: LysR substrate-binding domain-containing protein [Polaromonas sp.]|uniref:LysR substrate-binding domain-containing protein n=1 Tax=Polaromonas sp. TaxID=1869339 RepID=UPI002732A7AD|nr:LysR substrate-binding domain-containing protein [Polaromonas sp.]MDP3799153.1 LysR substrate-binding domain-containing protein [Polaromonas sp.]
MQDLDPHLLRAFLAVIDVGTVNGAAAALHRTQAAVSMQIRRLEDIAGAPLFERSPKGLTANAEGRVLEPYAREILTLNEEARQRISGQRMEGRVKLGVVEDFAATRLIDILKSFRDQNPKVHLDLIIAGNRQLAALFEQDKLDLLICDTLEVAHKPLVEWPEQLLWIVRSDLMLTPNDALPVVMFSDTCPWRTRVMESLTDSQLRWSMVCEASTLVAMATAVQVGIGIGPMISATIPPGCRVLAATREFPAPIQIGIGLYARTGASDEANYLADFVTRMPGRLAV